MTRTGSGHSIALQRRRRNTPAGGPRPRRLRFAAGIFRLAGRFRVVRVAVFGVLGWGAVELVQGAHAYATADPRFEARRLSYAPTPHVDVATVRRILGFGHGENLLSVDLSAMATRLAGHPWVARARVQRRLPDTLVVEVEEHQATALLLANRPFLVNRDGLPFKVCEGEECVGLPVITGVDAGALLRGRGEPPKVLARAVDVVRAWNERIRPPLGEVHVEPDGGLVLYTAVRGTQLRLGRAPVRTALARYDTLRAALGPRAADLARVSLDAAGHGEEAWVAASFFRDTHVPNRRPQAQVSGDVRGADRESNRTHGRNERHG